MSRLYAILNKWHIIIIASILLALSCASWIVFARSAENPFSAFFESGSTAGRNDSDDYDTEDAQDPSSAVRTTKLSIGALCSSVDLFNGIIDSYWSVYKTSFLSRKDCLVSYCLTGDVSSTQVIAGNNRWLFYKSESDGDSIGDYEGTNMYSEQRLNEICQAALTAARALDDRGIEFAVLVAPNKENIYYDYMPDTYTHSEESRTDILIDYLIAQGINAVSPKEDLLANRSAFQVYYSYDTHWNQLGAYIGVRDTLSSWGIEIPELSDRTIFSKDLKGNYHYCGSDDLAGMTDLRLILTDEKEYEIEGTIPLDWEAFESEQNDHLVSHYCNEQAVMNASVLLVGDSFRSSMVPALREQFSDVYVVHREYYDPEMLDTLKPDYLIAEYVERYSNSMESIGGLVA